MGNSVAGSVLQDADAAGQGVAGGAVAWPQTGPQH